MPINFIIWRTKLNWQITVRPEQNQSDTLRRDKVFSNMWLPMTRCYGRIKSYKR